MCEFGSDELVMNDMTALALLTRSNMPEHLLIGIAETKRKSSSNAVRMDRQSSDKSIGAFQCLTSQRLCLA